MERTGAMKAFVIAYLVVLAVLAQILLSALGVLPVLQKPGSGDPSGFVVPLAVFGLLMLVIIVAAARWHRAPRTPWFWLAGAIPGILFFLPDIPIIIQAATSPESVLDVVLAVAVTGGCVVLLISALLATDPPYGVSLDPTWRDGVYNDLGPAEQPYMRRTDGHRNTTLSGDTRVDWSAAFELVPSLAVGYVWHAGVHAATVGPSVLGLRARRRFRGRRWRQKWTQGDAVHADSLGKAGGQCDTPD